MTGSGLLWHLRLSGLRPAQPTRTAGKYSPVQPSSRPECRQEGLCIPAIHPLTFILQILRRGANSIAHAQPAIVTPPSNPADRFCTGALRVARDVPTAGGSARQAAAYSPVHRPGLERAYPLHDGVQYG